MAALPPGGEQLLGVFDLKGFELRNADIQFAAFLVEAFFEYYPRRWGGEGRGFESRNADIRFAAFWVEACF